MASEIVAEPTDYSTEEADLAWAKSNLLSLDGGGIRGYWSLLALQKLMGYIATEEGQLDEDEEVLHSFHPLDLPDDVSQLPLDATEERRNITNASDADGRCRAMHKTRRFLPCHYFDFICGSSTGALIAIMLGRFRMAVPDCIHEYKSLGEEVFGRPRHFFALRFGLGDRTKYKAARLEKVIKDVTARRNEQLADSDPSIRFPSGRGMCKTFVTSLRTHPDGDYETLYFIRSYDHEERSDPAQSTLPSRHNTAFTSRSNTGRTENGRSGNITKVEKSDTNHGKAQQFQIWEVARAATAAKFFFEPLKIPILGSPENILFEDGGFSVANNPTLLGTQELEDLYGRDSLGIIVSVGTARKDESKEKKSFYKTIPRATKKFAAKATDPEAAHKSMKRKAKEAAGSDFSYHRLNDPGKLEIELDEWEPRKTGSNRVSGSTTLNKIETAFNEWAAAEEVGDQLRSCAAALVKCRRSRLKDEDKWERFATGARFTCLARGRCEADEFLSRTAFHEHLLQIHRDWPNDRREQDRCKKKWRYKDAP